MTVKVLLRENRALADEGRWDLDYHLPPELIAAYPHDRLTTVSQLAHVSKLKRDPGTAPEATFQYVDIASVDVATGSVANPQELTGEEAPSRARMVIKAYDVVVSTVRPTRGATAVVPERLHDQICSTGFTVLRCKEGVNPYYLHYVLRLPSTLEQFRKFSTGSSYPAILDTDVLKTVVPGASGEAQDAIARATQHAHRERERILREANEAFSAAMAGADAALRRGDDGVESPAGEPDDLRVSREEIAVRLADLASRESAGGPLFADLQAAAAEDVPV
ncbi:MAG TPA: restriction endonuclease subunit S [Conexibacter sp.]|nr:restriction endonuclease subunit S [Conexibacter sp.]